MAIAQVHHRVNVWAVFAVLVVLTGLELWLSAAKILDGTPLLLAIVGSALIKAAVVAWNFMHMKFEGVLIWVMIIGSLVIGGAFILVLFPDLVNNSYWKQF